MRLTDERLAAMGDGQLECREVGRHAYDRVWDEVDTKRGQQLITFRRQRTCGRCGTIASELWQVWPRLERIRARSYSYPDHYVHVTGEPLDRSVLMAGMLLRTSNLVEELRTALRRAKD